MAERESEQGEVYCDDTDDNQGQEAPWAVTTGR